MAINLKDKYELVPGDNETWSLEEIFIYFIDNKYAWRFSQVVLDDIYKTFVEKLLAQDC